jgi:hypothetical protein
MLKSNGIRIIHVSRAFIESMVAHSLYGAPALRGATSGYDYALRGLGGAGLSKSYSRQTCSPDRHYMAADIGTGRPNSSVAEQFICPTPPAICSE